MPYVFYVPKYVSNINSELVMLHIRTYGFLKSGFCNQRSMLLEIIKTGQNEEKICSDRASNPKQRFFKPSGPPLIYYCT